MLLRIPKRKITILTRRIRLGQPTFNKHKSGGRAYRLRSKGAKSDRLVWKNN
jgi:hypothetical protein